MVGQRGRDDSGAVAVAVALMTVVLCGMAALVVDLGMARDADRTAQNAADAAALAAASSLATTTNPAAVTTQDISRARDVAATYALSNGWSAGIATFTVDPAAATVTLTLTPVRSPAMFAGVLGSSSPTVGASAQATWRGAAAPCALCVLADLSAQNGQTVSSQGSVLVGGGLSVSPRGVVSTASGIIGVVGAISNNGTVTPSAVAIASVTDPYAILPQLPPGPPAQPLGSPVVAKAAGPSCSPGTYGDITACRTFTSGIYVVTGANKFAGTVTVDASSGVLFYLTCSSGGTSAACAPGGTGGSIDIAGNVTMTINALATPAYRGLAVVYDRNNAAPVGLVGGTDVTINGGVYAASATLRNNGTGALAVNGTVVVRSVDMRGSPSSVTVDAANAYAPQPPMLTHLSR